MKKIYLDNVKPGQIVEINPKTATFYPSCCDCGLVHKQKFKIKNDKIQIRTWRDENKTIKSRKIHGIHILF